jgi:hypothetical protein
VVILNIINDRRISYNFQDILYYSLQYYAIYSMQNPGLGMTMKTAVYWYVTTPDLMKISTFRVNLFFFYKVGSGASKPLFYQITQRHISEKIAVF